VYNTWVRRFSWGVITTQLSPSRYKLGGNDLILHLIFDFPFIAAGRAATPFLLIRSECPAWMARCVHLLALL
jgi:hypothetical protein